MTFHQEITDRQYWIIKLLEHKSLTLSSLCRIINSLERNPKGNELDKLKEELVELNLLLNNKKKCSIRLDGNPLDNIQVFASIRRGNRYKLHIACGDESEFINDDFYLPPISNLQKLIKEEFPLLWKKTASIENGMYEKPIDFWINETVFNDVDFSQEPSHFIGKCKLKTEVVQILRDDLGKVVSFKSPILMDFINVPRKCVKKFRIYTGKNFADLTEYLHKVLYLVGPPNDTSYKSIYERINDLKKYIDTLNNPGVRAVFLQGCPNPKYLFENLEQVIDNPPIGLINPLRFLSYEELSIEDNEIVVSEGCYNNNKEIILKKLDKQDILLRTKSIDDNNLRRFVKENRNIYYAITRGRVVLISKKVQRDLNICNDHLHEHSWIIGSQ